MTWCTGRKTMLLSSTLTALLTISARGQLPGVTRDESPESPRFLQPPPREVLQQGLEPLASQLPDSRVREGLMPPDAGSGIFGLRTVEGSDDRGTQWTSTELHWHASGIRYQPLYFEDAMLERHGQSRHPWVQPWASGTRFFLTIPALPYASLVNSPCQKISALGHFRVGDRSPLLLQRPPLQTDAGLFEAGLAVGLIFLVP